MEFCSLGDLSNYIKRRGDVNSIAATDPGAPPLKPNGLNEYVVRHFLLQLGILNIFILFLGTRGTSLLGMFIFFRDFYTCALIALALLFANSNYIFIIHCLFIIYIFFQQTRWSF
jgi:hypothetical protein